MGNYGDRIKKARESVGLTQEQLGKKIGVTGVTIMRYEKNQREPRQKQLHAIADALNVPIYELYGGVADGDSIRFERDIDPEVLRSLPGYIEGENGQFSVEPGSEAEKKLREIIIGAANQEPASPDKARLDAAYAKLNPSGQKEAVKRVEELTEIPRYQKEKSPADGD